MSDAVVDQAILVVDDDPSTLRFLSRMLDGAGLRCDTASSVAEAMELLERTSYSLVLSDVDMPGGSGLQLLELISLQYPDVATVMVTGVDDRDVAEHALRDGAYGYVIKPFETNELLIMISNALRRRALEIENRAHRTRLEVTVKERTAHLWDTLRELEQANAAVRASHEKTIHKLAIAAEYRDNETADHVNRMSRYAELLAAKAGMDPQTHSVIGLAAMMHDVGKIGVADSILLKPGPLDDEERAAMQRHAEIGYRILTDDSPLLSLAASIAYTHHERQDGTGYPRGLKGEEIPLEGRVAAIADVFDALTTNRVYRRAFPLGRAVEMMVEGSGTQFDAELLDLFLSSMDELLAVRDGLPRTERRLVGR